MGNSGSSHPTIPKEDLRHIRELGFTVDRKQIGEGMAGKVYIVRLKQRLEIFGDQKTFAIKMINLKERLKNTDDSGKQILIKMMEREKAIMSEVSHPNVVSIHLCLSLGECFSQVIGGKNVMVHDRVYMIMDLADQSLFDYLNKYIQNKSLPEREAKSLCRQLTEGLQYLHTNRIFHGDIHMRNVLIFTDRQTKQKIPKWADYGLAQRNVADPALFADDVSQYRMWVFEKIVNCTKYDSIESQTIANELVEQIKRNRVSLDQILDHNWLKNN